MSVEWLGRSQMSHVEARAQVVRAFGVVFGREPSMQEAQFAQAMALCETRYGSGWSKVCGGAGEGSNNVGAIQAGTPPCGKNAFECIDTHEDGTKYAACFRSYATIEAGFDHFITILYLKRPRVLSMAGSSIEGFSTELRASGYFELALERHILLITECLRTVTKALGEPMPPIAPSTPLSKKVLDLAVVGGAGYLIWKYLL